MDETMRGVFSSEYQGTAPPWSGGWLADPMEAIEQPTAMEALPRLLGGTTSNEGRTAPTRMGMSSVGYKLGESKGNTLLCGTHVSKSLDKVIGDHEQVPKGHPAQEQESLTFVGGNETQGKYVQAEERNKKLFVGMAPKSAYEEDYKVVFEPFGTPVEVYVIRDRNGFSKGCAFVKYESVKSASNAIEALHDKYIMAGGFRTLVVTVADDRREPPSPSSRNIAGGGDPSLTVSPPSPFRNDRLRGNSWSLHSVTTPGRPVTAPQPTCPRAATALQPPVVAGMSHVFCGGVPPQGTYVYYPFVSSSASDRRLSSKPHHAVTVGSGHGLAGRCDTCENSCGCAKSAGAPGQCPVYAHVVHEDVSRRKCKLYDTSIADPGSKGRQWAKQTVGPPGANLFVYYLPGFLSDAGLATAFAPFGQVLSAKIYYDRDTGESKGFGFVSYADPDHADAAIARMNGFCIGQKRLKVVRKRGQQRVPDTSSPVTEPCNGVGGNGNTDKIPHLSGSGTGGGFGCGGFGSFGGFGCGGFGFGLGLGRDSDGCGGGGGATGRCDLKGETPSELDLGTPEGLLGPSMTRFL